MNDEINRLIELAEEISKKSIYVRRGQAYFNIFFQSPQFQNITKELTDSEFDPYYNDERIPAFLAEVERRIK